MAGIAGIASLGKVTEVNLMLDKLAHRGTAGRKVNEIGGVTLGIVWPQIQTKAETVSNLQHIVRDDGGDGHFAQAQASGNGVVLMRDQLGVAPIYYGWTQDNLFCFASEVKALLPLTQLVQEVLPGHRYDGTHREAYYFLQKQHPLNEPAQCIAQELLRRLNVAIEKNISNEIIGAWLSGGLDSSTMAALARPYVKTLYTFASGLSGAPDLEYARIVAEFIKSEHHEIMVTFDDMLKVLPKVIYHLESFDALLVRSSILNYLTAKRAADYVPAVFSGEGGDELFAGYNYLKSLYTDVLADELIDIASRLHNTALQRVDRSAAAHGIVAYTGFLNPDVVDYALRIPVEYKLHNGVEKWILRQALAGKLPERVLSRTKSKFWEGSGVGEMLSEYADKKISDADFHRERNLSNGWQLNTKEELMYYRLFRDQFGELTNLSWMGRSKGAPKQR